jgi:hypothetical protein
MNIIPPVKTLRQKVIVSYKAFKLIWSLNKKYIAVVFFSELLTSLKILPYIYLLQTSVSTLLYLDNFGIYAARIMTILGVILFLELSISLLKKMVLKEEAALDFRIRQEFVEKNDRIDYYTLSTKEYFVLREKATEAYNSCYAVRPLSPMLNVDNNSIALFNDARYIIDFTAK